MGEAEPPTAWRYCGHQIKLWRERAGVTREQLAKEAGYDYEYVKSMELGRRRPTTHLLQVADHMCDAGGLLLAAQGFLKPERTQDFGQAFLNCEAEAIAFSACESLLIPGLLQTEETARLMYSRCWPPLDDATIEERLAIRMGRQALLQKQSTAFAFVIGEVPLRYQVSDEAEARKRQLLRVLEVGAQRNVTVQVRPAKTYPAGYNGSFAVIELPNHECVAYEEGNSTSVLTVDPEIVSGFAHRQAMIGRLSLCPEESEAFIRNLVDEL
ncbi:helix-turn-helix domain-containing protein [Streptomyces sp. NPDC052396]|uniref:helix-turn-helix domain-containing protein n=1 Tax=Streptomyces sp. NPDC052396 TaxID=3365689 RepID=UPI0037D54127